MRRLIITGATSPKQLTIHCEFADVTRERKVQIIQIQLHRKALKYPKMTLDHLLVYGHAFKAADRQADEMEQGQNGRTSQNESINSLVHESRRTPRQPRRNKRHRQL